MISCLGAIAFWSAICGFQKHLDLMDKPAFDLGCAYSESAHYEQHNLAVLTTVVHFSPTWVVEAGPSRSAFRNSSQGKSASTPNFFAVSPCMLALLCWHWPQRTILGWYILSPTAEHSQPSQNCKATRGVNGYVRLLLICILGCTVASRRSCICSGQCVLAKREHGEC